MKTDDFEKQLQRQPLKKIPDAWRAEILQAASGSRLSALDARPTSWWRELLWPCPQAWAGLAAISLLLLAITFSTADRSTLVAKNFPTSAPEMIMALREQEQLLAELIGPREMPVAERPKTFVPRPRSERREKILTA